MPSRPVQGWFYLLLFFIFPVISIAQPGASVSNLKKPQKYEKRILASEKSDQGKFSPIKRASQNLNTRYNFFFNSERKLSEILANARSQYRDNYGLILPFYDFSLDNTADQKNELDRTCAMLSALDVLVSAPTAVSWLAAGAGVPTLKLHFNYSWTAMGQVYEPFAPALECVYPAAQGEWADVFRQVMIKLS